jgi:CheY-like chemotaxis protein
MSESIKTVLIAEDEEQLRRLLVRLLSGAGFTLLVAENGQAAWELLQTHQGTIDLLLSNIVMPHMTGVELAERASKARPEMKILLISAYDEGLLVLGKGWMFLAKPFSPKALLEKIHEVLSLP